MPRKTTKPESGPADEVINECLSGRIRLLHRTITGIYDDALRPIGLTAGQLTLLSFIDRLGPIAPGTLAKRLRMEKSTVSRNLARMQRNGWITIDAGGAGHTQIVEIARKGRTVLTKAMPHWRAAQVDATRLLGAGGAASVVKAFKSVRSKQVQD